MTRRVLVTGGGSGIGRAIAQGFADAGHAVTITGRRLDPLTETSGGRMTCVTADVTDEAEMQALCDQPFDVVVANAGTGAAAPLQETSLDLWNQTIGTTLTGVFLTFRAALAGMPKGGRLIAIGSTQGLKGGANITAYSAAKHGVIGLVRSLAHEVAPLGITCNAVCPGFVETPMAKKSIARLMARTGISHDDAVRQIASTNPVGRMITPEEVASAVLYLASAEAAMINGHALSLSGGEV